MNCLIAITGPTSAGKTYFSKILSKKAEEQNIKCMRVSTDEFYKDLSSMKMEERIKVNYDHPDSIDQNRFIKAIETLSKGQKAELPVYDFSTHTRTGETRIVVPVDLIIVEGIFALSFEAVLKYYTIAIYVDLEPDLRLIRRITRDTKERGRSLESIFDQYLNTVKPTQKRFVHNDREKADIILSGDKDHSIVYELILNFIRN